MATIAQISEAPKPVKRPAVLDKIDKFTADPPEGSVVMEFDPEAAKAILMERNANNRPLKVRKVERFADDLSDGRWGLTGDTLKFSPSGRLLDGQNRLSAVVRSGTPMLTHVVFGIDEKLFSRMDVGKPRSAADVLAIAKFSYASARAAAIRWSFILDGKAANRGVVLEPDRVLRLARSTYKGPIFEAALVAALKVNRAFRVPIGQAAALYRQFALRDEKGAADFFGAWASGRKDGRNRVIAEMQDFINFTMQANGGRMHEVTRLAIIITGWNLFRQRKIGRGFGASFRKAAADSNELPDIE